MNLLDAHALGRDDEGSDGQTPSVSPAPSYARSTVCSKFATKGNISPAIRCEREASLMTVAVPSIRRSTCRGRRQVTARGASTAIRGTTAAWTSPGPAMLVATSRSRCCWRAIRSLGLRARRPLRSAPMARWCWRGRPATTLRRYPYCAFERRRRDFQCPQAGGSDRRLFRRTEACLRCARRTAPGARREPWRTLHACLDPPSAVDRRRPQFRPGARDLQPTARRLHPALGTDARGRVVVMWELMQGPNPYGLAIAVSDDGLRFGAPRPIPGSVDAAGG